MTKVEYLNEKLKNKHFYNGPKSLFKYRPFDEWSFDMLEKEYLYCRTAGKEDDETECTAKLNGIEYISLESIRKGTIDAVLDDIASHTSKTNYEEIRQLVYSCILPNGRMRNHYLLDCSFKIKELVPGYNTAPLINYLAAIPNSINDDVVYQIYVLIQKAIKAREEIGICALSERPDIDDLWNIYADNSHGYCIEYEIEGCDWLTESLFPVIYEDDREYDVLTCLYKNYVYSCINKMSIEQNNKDISHYLRLFITKFSKWSEQKEWRIIGKAEEHKKAPKIKRIYFGKNISEENYIAIKKYCEDKTIEYVKL